MWKLPSVCGGIMPMAIEISSVPHVRSQIPHARNGPWSVSLKKSTSFTTLTPPCPHELRFTISGFERPVGVLLVTHAGIACPTTAMDAVRGEAKWPISLLIFILILILIYYFFKAPHWSFVHGFPATRTSNHKKAECLRWVGQLLIRRPVHLALPDSTCENRP